MCVSPTGLLFPFIMFTIAQELFTCTIFMDHFLSLMQKIVHSNSLTLSLAGVARITAKYTEEGTSPS